MVLKGMSLSEIQNLIQMTLFFYTQAMRSVLSVSQDAHSLALNIAIKQAIETTYRAFCEIVVVSKKPRHSLNQSIISKQLTCQL